MDEYKAFLKDLIFLLQRDLVEAKKNKNPDDPFELGYGMGIYYSLSLIQSQAIAFDLSFEEIGLDENVLNAYLK